MAANVNKNLEEMLIDSGAFFIAGINFVIGSVLFIHSGIEFFLFISFENDKKLIIQ